MKFYPGIGRLMIYLFLCCLGLSGPLIPLATVEPEPPLVVGIATGYPPYQYVGAKTQPAGLDAELAKLVFARMRQEFIFRQEPWDVIYLELAHHRPGIDLLCGTEVSADRLGLFEFTQPMYQRRTVVFVKSGSPYRNLADLAGKPVTGDRNSFVERHADLDSIRISNTASKEESFRLLMAGKVEGVIAPLEVGKWFSSQLNLPLRNIFDHDPGTPVAFALGKGQKNLKARINQAILELERKGSLIEVLQRYGVAPLTRP